VPVEPPTDVLECSGAPSSRVKTNSPVGQEGPAASSEPQRHGFQPTDAVGLERPCVRPPDYTDSAETYAEDNRTDGRMSWMRPIPAR
jgi:hypothetical protein